MMECAERLLCRRSAILAQLAALGPMRKGTLVEQMVQKTRGDGSRSQLGPYTLYTFKRDGKTLSRRLGGGEQVSLYRAQIAEFRRFQELTAELAGVGHALADLEAAGEQVGSKKNSRS
jgi:hypothetical protein